jgi:hypothetical protein
LNDLKQGGIPNVVVTDNTLVEALIKSEEKLDLLYVQVKEDDRLYDEAMLKIRGVPNNPDSGVPESMA